MFRMKVGVAIVLSVALVVASVVAFCQAPNDVKPEFAVRKVEAQTVLYTLYRGPYDKVGPAIGKLFALAGEKQIPIRGPLTMVYLTNPNLVAPAHYLTELRVPVAKDALKVAGTLGEFTDVKELPALDLAVTVKGKGVTEVSPLFDGLYKWARENGYEALEGPWETTLKGAETGDYAKMTCELALPVTKLVEQK